MDRTVRTVRDVANSSKVRPICAALDRSRYVCSQRQKTELLVSSPLSIKSTDLPQGQRHSMSGVGVLPGMGPASSTTPFSSDSSPVDHPFPTGTPSQSLLVQAKDVASPVQDNSPGDSKMVSNPPWNPAASPSASIVPHHLGSVDPSPRPSHPPPTTQENHDPPSFARLGAAKAQVRISRGPVTNLLMNW